jgi:hypothetical protein
MDKLKEVLTLVASGQRSFKPESQSEDDMMIFQSIAKALVSAEKQGLVEKLAVARDYQTPGLRYAEIAVIEGLSYEGEQFLAQEETSSFSEKSISIAPVKPVTPSVDSPENN